MMSTLKTIISILLIFLIEMIVINEISNYYIFTFFRATTELLEALFVHEHPLNDETIDLLLLVLPSLTFTVSMKVLGTWIISGGTNGQPGR